MAKPYLGILWLIMTLIPAPFLFHFYEYGQYVKRKDAPFLTLTSVLFVLIVGFLSGLIRNRYVVLVNILVAILSVVLALNFLPDNAWFAPVGRNVAVILTAIVFLIGQLLVRAFSKHYFTKKY
ncbi:hypothetical protein GCM10011409_15440 [Lentibacillus populi]|uniref:Uncharacterized protein n=1 Tax=Lentibacillus populi TaxID=1827502 RepID=A0A9W5X518_9BACI|nr:hypothetical protein [Lentibacillus populi]GGB38844.1 hypothetical protein GCM10011409_15440 [Lentibacillus populi]